MRLTLVFIMFFGVASVNAQHISVIKPGKKLRRVLFTQGDDIFLKMKDKTLHAGYLSYVSDTLILINDKVINKDSIAVVYDYSRKHFFQTGSVSFPVAGVLFAGLTSFNRLINNEGPLLAKENMKVSGSLIGLGLACVLGRRDRYDLTRNARLTILE